MWDAGFHLLDGGGAIFCLFNLNQTRDMGPDHLVFFFFFCLSSFASDLDWSNCITVVSVQSAICPIYPVRSCLGSFIYPVRSRITTTLCGLASQP
jgi:hypothetical protein